MDAFDGIAFEEDIRVEGKWETEEQGNRYSIKQA